MSVDISVLGPLAVSVDGRSVGLTAAKQRVVLAALAMHAPRTVSSDELVDMLWGERPPKTADHAVHVHVAALRKALGDGAHAVETRPTGYALGVAEGEIDATRFEQLVTSGRRQITRQPRAAAATLRRALSLWRGAAYADVRDEPWATIEIARLEELRLCAFEGMMQADLALGRAPELIGELRALTKESPYRERLWHLLITALYRSGQAAEALSAARELRSLLDEIGALPAPELQNLERQILQHDPLLSAQLPQAEHDLPSRGTRLLGRQGDVAALAAMLRASHVRLVTVRGPGGVGKTRVAIETAHIVAPDFPGGAYFVALGGLSDATLVLPAVAQRLGASAASSEGLPVAIAAELRGGPSLVVLDNAEHLADAAGPVAALLDAAPNLTVLLTSRTRLRMRGEHDLLLAPLEVPPAGPSVKLDDVDDYPSMALFAERAEAVDRGFRLERDLDAVAGICRRLDGLPLAIELAAARVALFPAPELLSRLDRRLDVLVVGQRDAPPRHQTLRATIAWSEELLDPAARTLFARLSVFASSFPLEAVESVAGDGSSNTLLTFETLLDGSLLYTATNGRFAMLETIREVATTRLEAMADSEAVRQRHALWALDEAEAGCRILRSGRGRPVLQRLASGLDDFRRALVWLRDHGDVVALARLVVALEVTWLTTGHVLEGLRWLKVAASLPELPPGLEAATLASMARLAMERGDLDGAREPAQAAVALATEVDAAVALAAGFIALAGIAYYSGDYDAMRARLAQAEPLLESQGDEWHLAFATFARGSAALSQGNLDEAAELLSRAITAYEDMDDEWGRAGAETNLAAVHLARHRHSEARPLAEQAVARYEGLGERSWSVTALCVLAGAVAPTDLERAQRLAQRALQQALDTGQPVGVPECLVWLARFANDQGHHRDAARLVGAGCAVARRLNQSLNTSQLAIIAEIREAVRGEWEHLQAQGARFSPEKALALAQTLR